MATGSGGGSGGNSGGGGASGSSSSGASTSGSPGAANGGAQVRAGDPASTKTYDIDMTAAAPNIRLEALERRDPTPPGARLESLGKGASSASVDPKTNDIVIRRSGKVVERLTDKVATDEFAARKNLSAADRQMLEGLNAFQALPPEERGERRRQVAKEDRKAAELGAADPLPRVKAKAHQNQVEQEAERGRIRKEIERNDAEVYARIEAMKKAREAARARRAAEPMEPTPAPIAATRTAQAAQAAEARSDDTISRESPFAAPNTKIRIVPEDISSKFVRAGEKYYAPGNTQVVAFVDRGDKLETPSSAPQIAKSLVAIAEARGWDELRVKGTDAFRREVWLEASSRGIHVDGYKPSEVDKGELERRNAFTRDHNSVEKRSETFLRSTPADGVRKDPSLAGAYAAARAADLVAEAKMHPNSRKAFSQSVREKIADKLDAGRTVDVKLKVPEGKLVEHGTANYNFDPAEKPSYYVKLRDARGRELVQWGAGLRSAMQAAEAKPGDIVQLRVTESKGVVVEGNVRDDDGRIVGRRTVDAYRNEWQAVVTARAPAAERQVEQQRVR